MFAGNFFFARLDGLQDMWIGLFACSFCFGCQKDKLQVTTFLDLLNRYIGGKDFHIRFADLPATYCCLQIINNFFSTA